MDHFILALSMLISLRVIKWLTGLGIVDVAALANRADSYFTFNLAYLEELQQASFNNILV